MSTGVHTDSNARNRQSDFAKSYKRLDRSFDPASQGSYMPSKLNRTFDPSNPQVPSFSRLASIDPTNKLNFNPTRDSGNTNIGSQQLFAVDIPKVLAMNPMNNNATPSLKEQPVFSMNSVKLSLPETNHILITKIEEKGLALGEIVDKVPFLGVCRNHERSSVVQIEQSYMDQLGARANWTVDTVTISGITMCKGIWPTTTKIYAGHLLFFLLARMDITGRSFNLPSGVHKIDQSNSVSSRAWQFIPVTTTKVTSKSLKKYCEENYKNYKIDWNEDYALYYVGRMKEEDRQGCINPDTNFQNLNSSRINTIVLGENHVYFKENIPDGF